MNDLLTVIISLIGSGITSFLVAKYYGERWVEKRRNRMEHSVRLKDDFFKPWADKLEKCCKVDAQYSKEVDKMVPLTPEDPEDLQFYDEAINHLRDYEQVLRDWENLKQTSLKLSEELATFFEEIRVLIQRELNVQYYCAGYSGDEPNEYMCPNAFIRAVYEEVEYRLKTGRTQLIGNGTIQPAIYGEKKIYYLKWWDRYLARSADEKLMEKAQQLFSQFIEDERYRVKIKALMDKQKESYEKELEKVKLAIRDIIKSVELGNVIKGKCRYCP